MRILFYAYEYPPIGTGVSNAVFNLFREFSRQEDLHIDFVTSSLNNKWEVESVSPNITFYRIPVGKVFTKRTQDKQSPKGMVLFSLNAWLQTWKLILENKYDLAHFFGYPGGLVTLLFSWRLKYIVSLRGVDVPGYNDKFEKYYIVYKPLSRLVWKFADRVIANSKKFAELANETAPNLKIDVIPNGVDSINYQPRPESEKYKEFSITAGGTTMGPKKDLISLVRGFAKLNGEFPDTHLNLIGSGDLESELKQVVEDLSIEKAVTFFGRRPKEWVAENLAKNHVFCLPSLNEGMSNAALEALSSGLPLLLTDTGGTAELLEAGKNGFLIEKQNPKDIYDKLKVLYLDEDLRMQMGAESRERAEKMSWGGVAGEYRDIYKSY